MEAHVEARVAVAGLALGPQHSLGVIHGRASTVARRKTGCDLAASSVTRSSAAQRHVGGRVREAALGAGIQAAAY